MEHILLICSSTDGHLGCFGHHVSIIMTFMYKFVSQVSSDGNSVLAKVLVIQEDEALTSVSGRPLGPVFQGLDTRAVVLGAVRGQSEPP